ncbi:hypothetical protein ACMU_08500 [Actibacterium mucosum KCTC 23349]|uniref:DUF4399 domain-containing protein n=2 Tax=Actibacterium TaxID=1433986 RepID=A0A037ZH80_9RHOB|nr:hypothetical protein ACMU_08500 [Actibacterium mucosum KCTC 23349]
MIGVVAAPVVNQPFGGTQPDMQAHHATLHGKVEADPDNPPKVALRVEADALSGWNVYVDAQNFTFAPQNVNQANIANEGHAHLYLNGAKVARLYGPAFHLSNVPKGHNVVTVSLNANDHSDLTVLGEPIFAQVAFEQE